MFKLRVILYHIIKLYQYTEINIDKQCFYERSIYKLSFAHIGFSLIPFFFQFKPDKRTVYHDIVVR